MARPEWLSRALRTRRRREFLTTIASATLVLAAIAVAATAASQLRMQGGDQAAWSVVESTDVDGDAVPDVVENAIGTDPLRARPTGELPESWIRRFDLDVSDPELPNRTAPFPRPPDSPAVYGPGGLPIEDRVTLYEVYAYGRPASWDEPRDGAWDSKLDPRRYDFADSGIPYSWLIRRGIDPRDPALLDRAGTTVPWTPRQAYERGLDPILADADRDGLLDDIELSIGANPQRYSTGGSGIADGWLHSHGLDLLSTAIGRIDTDRDGLNNLEEFRASMAARPNATISGGGLDPRAVSTSGSGIPDGWLISHKLDPFDPDIASHVTEQRARDGPAGHRPYSITVMDEYRVGRPPSWNESTHGPWLAGSDPATNDSDSDGLSDLDEIVGASIQREGRTVWVPSDPTRADSDADGLADAEEVNGRARGRSFTPTDPTSRDSDFDGLLDGEEVGLLEWRGLQLPQLDPNTADSDADGLDDGTEALYWSDRSSAADTPYPWRIAAMPTRTALSSAEIASARIAAELQPTGDMDGDGVANLVDSDSDNDGLEDGWECRPELYRATPFAAEHPRSSTDPANGDTDGDELPDRWEITYGIYDAMIPGWNLDPALESSFNDGILDGARDLDDDHAIWHAYFTTPLGVVERAHRFIATNLIEFEHRSDPNLRSTSGDSVADGWKIFWRDVYPFLADEERGDVYPGAPGEFALPDDIEIPSVGETAELNLATVSTTRLISMDTARATRLSCEREFSVSLPNGTVSSICRLRHTFSHDHTSAVAHGTNPYLDDTDGDGLPDAWEIAWTNASPIPGEISPTKPDAENDADGDGLSALREWASHGDPFTSDTDLGGATDDIEARLRLILNDPTDDRRALDTEQDSDRDGLPDVVEVSGVALVTGARVYTDPQDPDTDRDGLLDGYSLSRALGRTLRSSSSADAAILLDLEARGLVVVQYPTGETDILGEIALGSDPSRLSTSGDGVPDGWAFPHWSAASTSTGLVAKYAYGRPAWWNESDHGIWRWGLGRTGAATRDTDLDGLDDLNGEDPIPYANTANELPQGDPRNVLLNATERLRAGQAYGGPIPRPSSVAARAQSIVALDPLGPELSTDRAQRFSGNMTTWPEREPVVNATIVFSLGSREIVIGVAITNETGAFSGDVRLARVQSPPDDSAGIPVFSSLAGDGVHINSDTGLQSVSSSSTGSVFAWAYNISPAPPLRQRANYSIGAGEAPGVMGNASASQTLNLSLGTEIGLQAPTVARAGSSVTINATLTDILGRPVRQARVVIQPGGGGSVTDTAGRTAFNVSLPATPGVSRYEVEFRADRALAGSKSTIDISGRSPTVTQLLLPPTSIRPNSTSRLAASLHTSTGEPIEGAIISIVADRLAAEAATDRTGRAAFDLVVPPTAAIGPLEISARFAGNATLEPSERRAGVVVRATGRWSIEAPPALAGGVALVAAQLLDHADRPMAARNVTLSVLSQHLLGETDLQGRVRWDFALNDTPPGDLAVTVAAADGAEDTPEETFLLSVRSATRLTATAGQAIRGRDLLINGSLTDAAGRALASQALEVRGIRSSVLVLTDAEGQWTLKERLDARERHGQAAINVTFRGTRDGVHLPTNEEIQVTVKDAAVFLLEDDELLVGRPVVRGRVVTVLGEPLGAREVKITAAAGAEFARTDQTGSFTVPLPVRLDEELGPHAMRLAVDGDPTLVRSEVSKTIVLMGHGHLEVQAPSTVIEAGTIVAYANVTDHRGASATPSHCTILLSTAPLPAEFNGGVLTARVQDTTAGRRPLSIECEAEWLRLPPWEGEIDVQRAAKLDIVRSTTAEGNLEIHLTSGGRSLANESLLVAGSDRPLRVVTDERGIATIPLPARRGSVEVAFLGNTDVAPAAVNVLTPNAVGGPVIPVEKSTPWTALLIAALAGGAAVMIGIARYRSRTATAVMRRAARRLRSAHPDLKVLYETYVALLHLLGLDEELTETLTFGDLVNRVIGSHPRVQLEIEMITSLFNDAIYSPSLITTSRAHDAARAFSAIADDLARTRGSGEES